MNTGYISYPEKTTIGFLKVEDPTIIEILDEIAAGTLSEGSTFDYKNEQWIYDGESIHTKEADYHDADVKDYLYLEDIADLNNLNDKVENLMRCYKFTISGDTFTNSEITATNTTKLKPSNWHYTSFGNKSVHCCPVCGGNGIVSNGFYNHTGNTWVTSTTAPEQCRSCHGKGYVVVDD